MDFSKLLYKNENRLILGKELFEIAIKMANKLSNPEFISKFEEKGIVDVDLIPIILESKVFKFVNDIIILSVPLTKLKKSKITGQEIDWTDIQINIIANNPIISDYIQNIRKTIKNSDVINIHHIVDRLYMFSNIISPEHFGEDGIASRMYNLGYGINKRAVYAVRDLKEVKIDLYFSTFTKLGLINELCSDLFNIQLIK